MKSLKELLGLKPEIIEKIVEKTVEIEKLVEKVVEKIVEVPVTVEKVVTVEKADKAAINYHLLANSVVLNFNGQTHNVAKDDARFSEIVIAIRENRLQDIPGIIDVKQKLQKAGFEYDQGSLKYNDESMPEGLLNKISLAKENGWPIETFLKFWENLKQNPSKNSQQMLYKFLEHNGHPLTDDGCFIAYRSVRQDFKDAHTGTFDNSPGSVCEMKRSEVDDNPDRTCSRGLHVATYGYAKGFSQILLEVKVRPQDVVAVPNDYNGTKMRTCRFEVIRVCDQMLNDGSYEEQVVGIEYLVKTKGEKKWTKLTARDMKDAAETVAENSKWFYEGEPNTVYVRKGSNYVEKFEF